MAKVVSFIVDDTHVFIETDAVDLHIDGKPSDGMQLTSSTDGLVRRFDEIQQLIVVCSSALLKAFKEIPTPAKVAVEFGVKLEGELGIPCIAKSKGEANFKINVEWSPTGGK